MGGMQSLKGIFCLFSVHTVRKESLISNPADDGIPPHVVKLEKYDIIFNNNDFMVCYDHKREPRGEGTLRIPSCMWSSTKCNHPMLPTSKYNMHRLGSIMSEDDVIMTKPIMSTKT